MDGTEVSLAVGYALADIGRCERELDVVRVVSTLSRECQAALVAVCERVAACRQWMPTVLRIVPRRALEDFVGKADASRLYGEWL